MEYRILGPLEVVRNGVVLDLGGRKQRMVLLILLLSAGRHVPTDRLIDDLWSGQPPAQAMSTLRAYLSNLRRALSTGGEGTARIVSRSSGYVLELDPQDRIDAAHVEQILAEVPDLLAAGALDRADTLLAEAAGLWRGHPLADVTYEPFALGEIARLEELRLVVEEQRLDVWLRDGRHVAAVGEFERLLRAHPHREALRGQLMLALYRSGRQGDALRAYADGRAVLVDDLGVEPAAELQRLQERILLQDPDLDWHPTGAPPAQRQRPAVDEDPLPPIPLIGRDREMGRLESALIATGSGASKIVLIGGEPGIGKTRLLEETSRRGRVRGAVISWGRCQDGLGAPAFWPWVEVLRSLVEEVGLDRLRALLSRPEALGLLLPDFGDPPAGVDEDTARFRLYDATAQLLRSLARQQRTVVLLEDLHWADPSSLHLLRFLATGPGIPGLLVAASYRDVEVGEGHPLRGALAALARQPAVERLRPEGLTPGDVERYIGDLTGAVPTADVAATVQRLTNGNPFFVAEMCRLLDGEVTADDVARSDIPVNVQDVIRRRLDQLPAAAVKTLVHASFGPQAARVPVLAELLGYPVDEVLTHCELAVRAQLVVEAEEVGAYGFAHALVGELLYRSVPALRRAQTHARIADLLLPEADGPNRAVVLPALAWHYARAAAVGRATDAARWGRSAAEDAAERLGFESAAEHLERALAVAQEHLPDDLGTRADIARALGVARSRTGELDRSRAALGESARLARALGDPVRLAKAALRSTGGGFWGVWSANEVGRSEIVPWLEEAMAALPPSHPLRAPVAARLGAELFFSSPERGAALAEEAVELARAQGNPEGVLSAISFMRLATWTQENTLERLALADDMVALSAQARPHYAAIAHHVRMVDRLESGDAAGFEEDLCTVEALVEETGHRGLRVQLAWNRAVRAFHEGRFAEAEERAAAAHALEARGDPASARVIHDLLLALIRCEQGRLADLRPRLVDNVTEHPSNVYVWQLVVVRSLADEGRLDEAAGLLAELTADGLAGMPRGLLEPTYVALLAEVCATVGDAEAARSVLAHVAHWTSRILVTASGHQAHGALDFYRGLLAAAAGDLGDAIDLHESGLAANRSVKARPFVARSCLALGSCLLKRGRPGDLVRGGALLDESLAIAGELGMPLVARAAQHEGAEPVSA